MAEKRMFSKRVITSDAFLDMPATTQLFYFHLSMAADDDGFVDSTRSVMRSVSATEQDMNTLVEKGFVIYFKEEGVSLIRHWQIANSIRKDLYKETKYKELKNRLSVDEDGAYALQERNESVTEPLPDRNEPVTEPEQNRSLDQISIDQDRLDQKREGEDPPSFPPLLKSNASKLTGLPEKNYAMIFEEVKAKWKAVVGQETKETLFQVSPAKRERFVNTLAIYSLDDIFNAIGNYHIARSNPEKFDIGGRIYGNLIGFLENGVSQFYLDGPAKNNFRKKKRDK
jgi:hypothetical protein